MFIKVLLLVVFFSSMVGIGLYCRRRVKNVGDFVLGGRSVGPWLTAFSYGTSYFSAVVFIGYAGQFGWAYGVSATWIGIGNAVIGSLLAWMILGRRTRIMTKALSASTMPEFFEKRYGGRLIKIVASMIIFTFLVPYTASVYKGLSSLFAQAFNIDYIYCMIGMAALTGIYVILGGYMATSISDFIQGIIMLVGIVCVIGAVLNGQGGFMEAINRLSQFESEAAVTAGQQGVYSSFFGPDPINLLGVVILTSLGTWGLPQMVHKFYSIKDERSIKTGTVISTAFALIVAGGSYFNGAFGRLYVDTPASVGGFDGIIPAMLGGQLNDLLMGIVIVLVLSASMSTLASLVLTSSSTLTLDLIRDQFVPNMKNTHQMLIIRILCAAFIVLSVVIAAVPNSLITSLMSLSWGALGGAFLAPFMYGLFWKGATRAAAWVSFAIGVGFTSLNMVFEWISPTNAGAIVMIASLIIFPLVSLVTKKQPREQLDKIFSCYDEEVTVRKRYALKEEEETIVH
ncbi:MAG: sodium/solute symporter [Clostridiales bacterium]|nr:sodium/solute symporter [Clostridiales bacterium]